MSLTHCIGANSDWFFALSAIAALFLALARFMQYDCDIKSAHGIH